jgi:nitroreductase
MEADNPEVCYKRGRLHREAISIGETHMDVFTAIGMRRSIRAYSDRLVEEEKLRKVLEAGRLAPSAKNRQEWKFIVVRDDVTRRKLAQAARGQRLVEQAPVTLVACAVESEYVMPCGQPAYSIDVAIAFSFMVLEDIDKPIIIRS